MRLLHTMLRVGDLQKSIAFYTDILNMKLLKNIVIATSALAYPSQQHQLETAALLSDTNLEQLKTEENNFSQNEDVTILDSIKDPTHITKQDKILTLYKENKKLAENNDKLNKLKIKDENKIGVTISISIVLAVLLLVSMWYICYLRYHKKEEKSN